MAAKFEIKAVKDGYRFNLKAANGEAVATSETYTTRADARRGAEACRRAAAEAQIVDVPDMNDMIRRAAARRLGQEPS